MLWHCPIAPYIYLFSLLLTGTSCRTFYDSARQLRGVSLYLDMQGEFALPARDYRVEASVSGWYNRLQQSRLAATGCPACTPGWTPQPLGTYTYRLEARVAWFYAARPALRGFRSSGRPSASVARFPQWGMILCQWPAAACITPSSRENCGRLPTQKRTCDSSVNLYYVYFLCGLLQVGWKRTPRRRVCYLQRNLSVHL